MDLFDRILSFIRIFPIDRILSIDTFFSINRIISNNRILHMNKNFPIIDIKIDLMSSIYTYGQNTARGWKTTRTGLVTAASFRI